MSSLIVRVSRVGAVREHSNADALEIVEIGGWQCVVPKGRYQAGELVVYVPPDTVLPQQHTDALGVTRYCSPARGYFDGTGERIRCARLRGEPSFGLVLGADEAGALGFSLAGLNEDEDVAALLGAQKYEPPVPLQAGDALPEDARFPRYTDIENLRSFSGLFREGEQIEVTEKIHGTNCRIGVVQGESMAGSHNLRRKPPVGGPLSSSLYWYPWTLEPVAAMMNELRATSASAVLYGEVYGRGVQSFHYGQRGLAFAAFDLSINGSYVPAATFRLRCAIYNVPVVPRLGTLTWAASGMDRVRKLASGLTQIDSDSAGRHIKEGVVLRPLLDRYDARVGRVILKYKSDDFLLSGKDG